MAVASTWPFKVPFLAKMLIRPLESPATISRLLLWFAMAKAVKVGTSSVPAGSWNCLCSWTVTFNWGPKNCEIFSLALARAAFSSFEMRRCRTDTRCKRMPPPESPVAMRCSSWVGDVAIWVIVWAWPVLKLNTNSPVGLNKWIFPSAWAATKMDVGIWGCDVDEEEDEEVEGRGLRRTNHSTWTTGSSKGKAAFVTKKSSADATGSLSPWLATSERRGRRSVRAWTWAPVSGRPLPALAAPESGGCLIPCFWFGVKRAVQPIVSRKTRQKNKISL